MARPVQLLHDRLDGGVRVVCAGLGEEWGGWTGLECCDALAALEDYACGFVAEDTVSFHDEGAYSSCFPEMNVRSDGRGVIERHCWILPHLTRKHRWL